MKPIFYIHKCILPLHRSYFHYTFFLIGYRVQTSLNVYFSFQSWFDCCMSWFYLKFSTEDYLSKCVMKKKWWWWSHFSIMWVTQAYMDFFLSSEGTNFFATHLWYGSLVDVLYKFSKNFTNCACSPCARPCGKRFYNEINA